MRAEILTVGTELLLGQVVNENARYLSQRLAALGYDVYFHTTVGDNPGRIRQAFRASMGRADLVVITGGLGPTQDDLTRETVAEEMGLCLLEDERALGWIEAFFRKRGRPPSAASRRQAMVPQGALALENPRGTAPGLFIWTDDKKAVVLLPGPPREAVPIWEDGVEPILTEQVTSGAVIRSRLLKVYGLGEPDVEERVRDLTHSDNPTLAPYTSGGEVHLRVTVKASTPQEAASLIKAVEQVVRRRLGRHLFATDDEGMEDALAKVLLERGLTLAIAESLTGGLVSSRLVNVPGASAFFLGGVTAYSLGAKEVLVGVPHQTLSQYGAVSWQCALAMASGVRKALGSSLGMGVTGVAGPAETGGRPTGTVYLAIDDGSRALVRRSRFPGMRVEIRFLASQDALGALWRFLGNASQEERPR